jgi:hypothetical protein
MYIYSFRRLRESGAYSGRVSLRARANQRSFAAIHLFNAHSIAKDFIRVPRVVGLALGSRIRPFLVSTFRQLSGMV